MMFSMRGCFLKKVLTADQPEAANPPRFFKARRNRACMRDWPWRLAARGICGAWDKLKYFVPISVESDIYHNSYNKYMRPTLIIPKKGTKSNMCGLRCVS
jgi:hypothetical protein